MTVLFGYGFWLRRLTLLIYVKLLKLFIRQLLGIYHDRSPIGLVWIKKQIKLNLYKKEDPALNIYNYV